MKCQTSEYYGWIITGNEEYAFAVSRHCESDIQYFTRDPDVNNHAYIRALGWAFQNPPDDHKPNAVGVWWRRGDAHAVNVQATGGGILYFMGGNGPRDRQLLSSLPVGKWRKVENPWE